MVYIRKRRSLTIAASPLLKSDLSKICQMSNFVLSEILKEKYIVTLSSEYIAINTVTREVISLQQYLIEFHNFGFLKQIKINLYH